MLHSKEILVRAAVLVSMSLLLLKVGGIVVDGEDVGISPTETPMKNTKVAVYYGPGVWYSGRIALVSIFEWMNASVTIVDAEDIKNGRLANFDLLCMPGGWSSDIFSGLGIDAISKIRDFVSGGGAYMGTCAGAFLAADRVVWRGSTYEYPLNLFPGEAVGPVEGISSGSMVKINIVNHTHPITASEPEYEWILYALGPEFHVDEEEDVTVLGTYDVNGQPAIVAFEYGSGRVFLTGPHPEIEEDCERDGLVEYNWLDDQGSDWPLMYEAAMWLTFQEGNDIPHEDVRTPVADAGLDKRIKPGTNVTFDASGSTDDVCIVRYEWDFGDGTNGTGKVVNHMYTELGTYNVTLRVWDAAGHSATNSITVKVYSEFPWWIVGIAGVVVAAGIAAGALVLWKRRGGKSDRTLSKGQA